MDNSVFIEFCKEKFSYLTEEFGFKDIIIEDDMTRLKVIYKKPGLKLRITNRVIEFPDYPIEIYFIIEEKKLLNRFFIKEQTYELDDLLIYRKCNSQVYEYLDYSNIETFYEMMSDEKLEYYREKYSQDEEIKIIIDRYSRVLKDYCSDILRGKFDVLPEVLKLREEYDDKYGIGTIYF